jgi:hypothetical protein
VTGKFEAFNDQGGDEVTTRLSGGSSPKARSPDVCCQLRAILAVPDVGQKARLRIGSHSVECHFGSTQRVLRNETRWERFLSAKGDAFLVREILADLKLEPYIRRFKTNAGHTLGQNSDALISFRFERIAKSLEFATRSFSEQSEQSIPFEESFLRSDVCLSELLEKIHHIETITKPSLTSGWGIMNRYFAASAMTTSRKQEPIKASQSHQCLSSPPSTPASTQLRHKPDSMAQMNPVSIAIAFTGK